ncbi:uncharacterized protein C1orf105-like isoform X1 [Dipodomys merriami]|uniref:uncharacterized protein C1orf105-like isoform X1 n=1 Tax=Dipodomys merriami TaxID=94247 RepID=UPI0038559B5D
MERRLLKASVPKFEKVPWLSEASIMNKPLVLSLPKRSPHFSATSFRKNLGLPILFQVPSDLWKDKNQNNVMLLRRKPLCPACQEIKMVQPTILEIPDDLKLSFEKLMCHRAMNPHQPKTPESESSQNDISTGQCSKMLSASFLARGVDSTPAAVEHSLQTAHHGPPDSCLPRAAVRYLPSSGENTELLTEKGTHGKDHEAMNGRLPGTKQLPSRLYPRASAQSLQLRHDAC